MICNLLGIFSLGWRHGCGGIAGGGGGDSDRVKNKDIMRNEKKGVLR